LLSTKRAGAPLILFNPGTGNNYFDTVTLRTARYVPSYEKSCACKFTRKKAAMKITSTACFLLIVSIVIPSYSFTRASEVTVRQAVKINMGWKFFKGTPAGNPYEAVYDDASWTSVCIPHSVDYTEPTQAAEAASYAGTAWYRKKFYVGNAGKKYFLEFEGAMQRADVWVNGVKVGVHDNSGYTGFSFDITAIIGGATEVTCAVRLDNTRSTLIPPARDGNAPDFFLFGGMYRNVWLVSADSVYVPFCGQFISTPTITPASGAVRFKTTVKNGKSSASNCTIVVSVRDKSGTEVATATSTQSVPANGSYVFDVSTAVPNPKLWSLDTPSLYHTYTTIADNGIIVDDYASTFGFRTLSWSSGNGFSLNGSRCAIQGACEHQSFAWVGNAVPDSRWAKEIELIKDAGYNAIRCSHYPRSQAFYNAADSIGILLMVEVPSWGFGQATYANSFWIRLNNCASEMVVQGYNHPSIFLWGLFNEPYANFSSQLSTISATIKSLDPDRATFTANNSLLGHENIPDVIGLNYKTIVQFGDPNTATHKYVTTEYFEGWNYYCERGNDCEAKFRNDGWQAYLKTSNQPQQHAGQFLWVFNDYHALWNPNKPMGLVDEYRLPKNLFYLFREQFTGKAQDTAKAGTATKLDLKADLLNLNADGSDFTVVSAAFRDDYNACIKSGANVTFAISGPARAFGNLTRPAAAGKTAIIVQATTDPGTITVTANSPGLPEAQVSIESKADLTAVIAPRGRCARNDGLSFSVRVLPAAIVINSSGTPLDNVLITDVRGRKIASWNDVPSVNVSRNLLAHGGVYVVRVKKSGITTARKIILAN
jgi:beta-galactosidase